jgi:hypothetical protein
VVPSETATFSQPNTEWQLSIVHVFPSLQFVGGPGAHVPLTQASPVVQASPSSHAVPLMPGVLMQPSTESQVSTVQTLPSLQSKGGPAVQTPVWQVSPPLQRFPSGHDVPSATGAL